MTSWGATKAKAQFSALLDGADNQGPQRIERRRKRYILLAEDEYEAHRKAADAKTKPFVSAWDALAPSSGATFDVDYYSTGFCMGLIFCDIISR